MRYIKVLLLASFIFLALVFFFQNQEFLSKTTSLTLDLFWINPITSRELPFYFIVACAFFVGCILSMCWLLWDKITVSTRYMRSKWKINSLKHEVERLKAQLEEANANTAELQTLPQDNGEAKAVAKAQS